MERTVFKQRAGSQASKLAPLLFFGALTGIVFRDLLSDLSGSILYGPDSLLYLWNTWWIGESLLTEFTSPYFSDAIYYPVGVSLLSHSFGLSAIAPWIWVSRLVESPGGVILSYNLTLLTAFSLSGLAAYILAHQETGSRVGGLVAGVVVAFSSERLAALGWLDLLSAQYMIFFLVFFLRALGGSRRAAVAAGLFAALTAYDTLTHVFFAALISVVLLVRSAGRGRRWDLAVKWCCERSGWRGSPVSLPRR